MSPSLGQAGKKNVEEIEGRDKEKSDGEDGGIE